LSQNFNVEILQTIDQMNDDEKARFLHQQMHEKHKGHDSMHAEMLFILIVTLIAAQFILFEWKKRHYKSYLFVSLLGLWLIPAGLDHLFPDHWCRHEKSL
jgi:RING finger protein 121/175